MLEVFASDHLKSIHVNLPDKCEYGLIIGHMSRQSTTVAQLVPTPVAPIEQTGNDVIIPTSWLAKHVKQVTVLLPGGLHVIGVFLVVSSSSHPPDAVIKSRENSLSSALSAIYRQLGKLPLLRETQPSHALTVCLSTLTGKLVCRQCCVEDTVSAAKPVKWTFRRLKWNRFSSVISVDQVASVDDSHLPFRQFSDCLEPMLSRIESAPAIVMADRLFCDLDLPLTSCFTSMPSHYQSGNIRSSEDLSNANRIHLLSYVDEPDQDETSTTTEMAASDVQLKATGQIHCQAFVVDKCTLGDVLLALSCDLRRSVYERLRMHCDSLAVTGASFRFHGDAGGDHRDELASPPADSVLHELPRRVLAPLAPSSGSRGKHVAGGVECLCVSDYLFPGDTTSDSLVTLVELFNIDISADLLDDNVEVFSDELAQSECSSAADTLEDIQLLTESAAAYSAIYSEHDFFSKLLLQLKSNPMLLIAAFVGLVAILFALFVFAA